TAARPVIDHAVAVVVDAVARLGLGHDLADARAAERAAAAGDGAGVAWPEPRRAARAVVAHLRQRPAAGRGLVGLAVAVLVGALAHLGGRPDRAGALERAVRARGHPLPAHRRRAVHGPAAARDAHAGEVPVVGDAVAVVVEPVAHLGRRADLAHAR